MEISRRGALAAGVALGIATVTGCQGRPAVVSGEEAQAFVAELSAALGQADKATLDRLLGPNPDPAWWRSPSPA